MTAAASAGVVVQGSALCFSSASRISVEAIIFRTSEFRRSTTACGVPAVVRRQIQLLTSKPASPDSAIVGTSGTKRERLAWVTASALSRPALISGTAAWIEEITSCDSPDTTSCSAWVMPL